MAARPDDTDEPTGHERDEPSSTDEGSSPEHDSPEHDSPAPERPEPDSSEAASRDPLGDIDQRFAGIVAGLRAEERPRSWTTDSTTAEVDDAHFEPPDPGPVLSGDPLLTVAWVAVLALPVALLLGVLVWNPLPSIVLQVCVVGFLLGLALLLWRMPQHRDEDDGPGAVV